MTMDLTAEQRVFRGELCAFLTSELTPEVRAQRREEVQYGGWTASFRREFRRKLGERGYIGTGWPVQYGGGGKDNVYELIFYEEMEYHDAPGLDATISYIPQALMAFGTEEQKRLLLPRLRRGDVGMFLGYSEPEAGSDLANLQTRAVEDGDNFVITGQKIYSSQAHLADYGFVAARTDPSSSRYSGISLFIVDMQGAGVSITKHRTVAGWDHHAVYFDHAVVPRTMLVGPLHQGWKVLMGAIDYERGSLGAPGIVDRQVDRLLAYALAPGGPDARPVDDPVIADKLVTLAVEAEAVRLYAYAVAERQARGERPQHETSLSILMKRETSRLADILGAEMLGPYAQLRGNTAYAPFGGAVEQEYREHLYFHFAAGGFDITRNVIAARGLKMPR